MDVKREVLQRYSVGAEAQQPELCCPVDYDKDLLKMLPQEIIDKDYGCGDPSRYVKQGDAVLDLGSGGGKICYMAAQLVGENGRVVGVDMNDDMLSLARRYQQDMADKLGGERVEFKKGYIQDLTLDLDAMNTWLQSNPVNDVVTHHKLLDWQNEQKQQRPLIESDSIDLVVSNCVLNLVHDADKQQLIRELYRVLRPGGRVAISDIVSDEDIPEHLKQDGELWSGCISGAFHEKGFLDAFIEAGFVAVAYDKWDAQPWRVIDDIEFRSVTLTAVKPESVACVDAGQAVIYKGPYLSVADDEGHVFPRGERMAVCDRTYRLITEGPYQNDFIGISPQGEIEEKPWNLPSSAKRPASETKGAAYEASCCGDSGCC
jgi:ubiquinone/menaquinone biosynthesis C-methylase UbiE